MSGALRRPARAGRRWVRGRVPEPGTARTDLVAGIPGAISSVPDGTAPSVDPATFRQMRRNRTVDRARDVELFEAGPTIGESSLDAYRDAAALPTGLH